MIESGNLWDFYVGTQQLATHDGCEDPLAALRTSEGGTLGLATSALAQWAIVQNSWSQDGICLPKTVLP